MLIKIMYVAIKNIMHALYELQDKKEINLLQTIF